MKVIKHGTTVHQHECKKCGCIFEYNDKEVDVVHDYNRYVFPGNYADMQSIKCPECDETYYLEVMINGENKTDEWNK